MANKVENNKEFPTITKSDALYARAKGLIPCVTQTLAKGPGQHTEGVAPKYVQRGKGARIWDVDGNEFLDLNMGIGPVVLGYGYPKVDEAIRAQLQDGITFSLMHPLEVEVAELVRSLVPNAESVRYSKTGADATTAAVRVARAFTKRSRVLCCGYHGWHDWYIAVTDRNAGIPSQNQDLSFTFNYNDLDSLKAGLDSDTAAVILEPTVFEAPKPGFLQELQALCKKNGTLLIFDEMWTGFRMANGGAQEFFGIKPDLATYSKAVANGMPISILTGRADVMSVLEKDVFFFTTFGGEALSLAAAKATMSEIKEKNVTAHIAKLGAKLRDGYNAAAQSLDLSFTKCVGMDYRTMVTFDPSGGNPLEQKSFVQQELIKRGVLWSGTHNLSFSHTEADIDYLLASYREVLTGLKDVVRTGKLTESLKGKPMEAVFRRVSNFNMKPAQGPKA